MPTLRSVCAGFAISATLVACALDSDDLGADTDELAPADEGLDLWTGIKKPPYHAAALALTHRVLELAPDSTGDIVLQAQLRWRELAAGAVEPQVSFGLVTDAGESVLAQVFQSNGTLRTRADLEMTDALEVGAWYRVVLTIGDAPNRPVQVRILDADEVEVWRSCSDAARCPSVELAPSELDSLRLAITVDDFRDGRGQVELKNVSLKRHP